MDHKKKQAAETALEYVKDDMVIGIGTGTTADYFIEALTAVKSKIQAVVASSEDTADKLQANGLPLEDLNSVDEVSLYVDSADEFNSHFQLLKGGGGAHTREKILASASKQFVCIVDESKESSVLGAKHPVPVEVIPMARSLVSRALVVDGADPVYRENFVTDNHNVIVDVYNLQLLNPLATERQLKQIPGVVCNGIFAQNLADILVVGTSGTTEVYHR
jgi:ribose 5-phosphate isomerase A